MRPVNFFMADNDRNPGVPPLQGLLIAQFFGAFNDNAWKLMVALLAIKQLASQLGAGPALEAASQAQTTLTFVVFTLPLVLVSVVAGVFSDRFSKRSVIVVMKAVEVVLMALGVLALYGNPSGGILPLIVLAGMAVQSALFSPAKYGILPELLPHERLAAGNGQLELWTFLAIIGGTGLGGVLLQFSGASPWMAALVLLLCSFAGFAASFLIPAVPRAREEGGLGATLRGAWAAVQADSALRLGIAGNVAYWTIASFGGAGYSGLCEGGSGIVRFVIRRAVGHLWHWRGPWLAARGKTVLLQSGGGTYPARCDWINVWAVLPWRDASRISWDGVRHGMAGHGQRIYRGAD